MRTRRLLVRAVTVLGALVLAALAAWMLGGLEPYGPIAGGRLRGAAAAPLPEDWSFVDRVAEVQVETRLGPLPWSVTTWCLSHEGRLYLPARNCYEKRWVRNALASPDVRVRIQGQVYELRAVREEDPEIWQALTEQMLIKYLGIEAERPQPITGVTPESDARAYGCAFRMEPRR